MKKLNKLFITVIFVLISITFNGCDPFDDIYLTLALETEFSTIGAGSNIFISNERNRNKKIARLLCR